MDLIFNVAKKYIWSKYISNGFENLSIKKDGLIIDYWDNKKDLETIVLIHGFGAQVEFQWYKQIEVLSKQYRVIIPNLLYFGNSSGDEKYNLQDQVSFITTLVNDLRLETFCIAGISYGGIIAAEFCNQHQHKINKLILVDAPVKFFTNENILEIYRKYNLENIEDLFAPTNYRGLKKQFEAAYYKTQIIPDFVYKALYKNLCLPNVNHWKKLIINLKIDLQLYAKREYIFSKPTLLIWGEYDDIVPKQVGIKLNNYFNNCRLEIIKKTKHLPNIEKSTEFNTILVNFLNETTNK
jgi:pimeloyl-ACP methyl ester carboxylesterase